MDSPPRLVLLLGAPRSGTTWLQGLLAAHPRVASPQETDVFSRYLRALEDAWAWQHRGTLDDWRRRRFKGLPAVLTTDEFREIGTSLLATTIAHSAALKPGADIVVEKSPAHSVHGDLIEVYAPTAPIVHLVRDGRDVAASLVAAGRTWGHDWAPSTVGAAAAMWSEHVRGARSVVARAAAVDTPTIEVRYEDLRSRGASLLHDVFTTIGVEITTDEATRLLTDQELGAMSDRGDRSEYILLGGDFAAVADRSEPPGFFGTGATTRWHDWSSQERSAFDAEAGALLAELGYVDDRSWVGNSPRATRRRVDARVDSARRGAARIARAAGTRLGRLLEPRPR